MFGINQERLNTIVHTTDNVPKNLLEYIEIITSPIVLIPDDYIKKFNEKHNIKNIGG